jgi:SPOR domain
MADRYQGRPLPADDHDRGDDPHASARDENDPLAELARLIGQTDPFGSMGRANQKAQPRANEEYDQYEEPAASDGRAAGPPPWLQRANRQEIPQPHHPPVAQRYATPYAPPEPDYRQAPAFADADHEPDPSRYDDALYGQLDAGGQVSQHEPADADDPYSYQDDYGDGAEDQIPKRRGGMVTVVAVLALAVVGTSAAFAYRTYVGSSRSGEPPIIRADAGPTKIVPAPSDGSMKLPDRMAAGDGTEKIVPREEAPVDVNSKSGPRVVFPPLNQNASPQSTASVGAPPATNAGNGTLPNNEPKKIKTLAVRGDQPDGAATPITPGLAPSAKPAATAARTPATPPPAVARSPANANAASSTAPLSLVPQDGQAAPGVDPGARVAATNPVQTAPTPAPASSGGSGGYLVQVSSQRNEADAQASYRALQTKFPAVLGSRAPVIKRADLGDKGVYYRAMVGPFGSPDEASQFCGSLKTAGGQCVVQRN